MSITCTGSYVPGRAGKSNALHVYLASDVWTGPNSLFSTTALEQRVGWVSTPYATRRPKGLCYGKTVAEESLDLRYV